MLPKKWYTDTWNSFIFKAREVSIEQKKIVLVGSGEQARLGELLAYLDKIQHILKGKKAAVIPFDKYKPIIISSDIICNRIRPF